MPERTHSCECGLSSGWLIDASAPLVYCPEGYCGLLHDFSPWPSGLRVVSFCWCCGSPLPSPSHYPAARARPSDEGRALLDRAVAAGHRVEDLKHEEQWVPPVRRGGGLSHRPIIRMGEAWVRLTLDGQGSVVDWSELRPGDEPWKYPALSRKSVGACECAEFHGALVDGVLQYDEREEFPYVSWAGNRCSYVAACPWCGGGRTDRHRDWHVLRDEFRRRVPTQEGFQVVVENEWERTLKLGWTEATQRQWVLRSARCAWAVCESARLGPGVSMFHEC